MNQPGSELGEFSKGIQRRKLTSKTLISCQIDVFVKSERKLVAPDIKGQE
jgi:hypothetical protein